MVRCSGTLPIYLYAKMCPKVCPEKTWVSGFLFSSLGKMVGVEGWGLELGMGS